MKKRGRERTRTDKNSDGCRTNKVKAKYRPSYAFKHLKFEDLSPDCSGCLAPDCKALAAPQPRSGHRIVCDDGNLYSFGGFLEANDDVQWPTHLSHGTQRLFQELWCYNFAEAQWKKLPTLGEPPRELASHSAVLHGNYLLIYGGTGVPFGGCSSNKVNMCDLRTLEWKCLETTGEQPTPQYGQAVVLDEKNRSFYVIGGTTGANYCMDVHKLDLFSLEWQKLFATTGDMDEPEPRYRHETAFDGTNILILGGGTATGAFDLKVIPSFDVTTKRWDMLKTQPSNSRFPDARKCQGSVQMDDDVFMCGGYDSMNIFFDLWKLNLPTMQWTALSVRMPVALYFHSASVTSAGCMYIFGGVSDMQRNKRTNQVFKVWLKVPKLKTISWEALLHYDQRIRYMKHEQLLAMGIPQEFARLVHPSPPCGISTSQHWQSDLVKVQQPECEQICTEPSGAAVVPICY